MNDKISEEIILLFETVIEPLETKEIEDQLKEKIHTESITRTKIFYRLNILRGEGKIEGKFTGPGKGVWIWWRKNAFNT